MDVTSEGERLIKIWMASQGEVQSAKSRLNSAECDMLNATSALAKWLLPPDVKMGEKIGVWFGDSLVQAECTSLMPLDGSIIIRSRGRRLSRL